MLPSFQGSAEEQPGPVTVPPAQGGLAGTGAWHKSMKSCLWMLSEEEKFMLELQMMRFFTTYTSSRRTLAWWVVLSAGVTVNEAGDQSSGFSLRSVLHPISLAQGNDWVPQLLLSCFLWQSALLYQQLFPEGVHVDGKLIILVLETYSLLQIYMNFSLYPTKSMYFLLYKKVAVSFFLHNC